MKKYILGLLVLLGVTISAQESTPKVKTELGAIRGVYEDGVDSFKAIPFAAPPVGEFRWKAPQPLSPWEGELDASEYGANCAQSGWGGAPGTISEGSSEDCLYLNVWKPADANTGANLPVMVWIHGGGFVGGSGSGAGIAGDEFAKKGVVLITINYRLGRLGHFAFPALSAEHPEEHKGSYAYMDQIAALQWVQKNIAAFGGNPDNVTIFGFSAGGVSVHSLMTIPGAKGLFHKAISESGGARDGVLTGRPIKEENASAFYPVSAETIGINFAKKHGIDGTDADALAKLRALPVEEIVDSGQETDGEGGPRIYSGPILDGKLVVETAESAYNAGRQIQIPLMIGSNSAEIGGSFVNNRKTKEELFSLFGEFKEEAQAAYDPDGTKDFEEVITKFNTDWVWGEPGRFAARAFAEKVEPTFIYHFGFVPEPMKERMKYGAGHGSEVGYVFNNLDARWGNPETTPEDKKVAELMNGYWVNFAKTGNPNGEGLPNWPVYTKNDGEIMDIQLDGEAVGKPDPRKARLDVIEKGVKLRNELQSRGI
ncbi:carboxylesterase family protein [Maribacter polysiphoniae]|uniref:Carboxylic ester hydrolase n=1 Tax=Maribacter polysiphoniae TaxID=429344 RepID=A0A316DNN5_9FLAO|nr:carboxylesterase family protein [Maribacter polysiphoniae]MBD1263139.1 carboxylesterase family protein [Maribacter polysiphoniae]PWK18363.1 para-nitrobenzyl esterase [Maribacter polysiphoniae]